MSKEKKSSIVLICILVPDYNVLSETAISFFLRKAHAYGFLSYGTEA